MTVLILVKKIIEQKWMSSMNLPFDLWSSLFYMSAFLFSHYFYIIKILKISRGPRLKCRLIYSFDGCTKQFQLLFTTFLMNGSGPQLCRIVIVFYWRNDFGFNFCLFWESPWGPLSNPSLCSHSQLTFNLFDWNLRWHQRRQHRQNKSAR